MHYARWNTNRNFTAILAAVTLMHALALLIPVARQAVTPAAEPPAVRVTLQRPAPPPLPEEPPVITPRDPVELAELPADPIAPVAAPAPLPEQEKQAPDVITAPQILNTLEAEKLRDPLKGLARFRVEERPDYYARYRPALDEVLNEPVLTLPFEDTRIYLVNFYDRGAIGGMQKFWDTVTVPFGFQTKNNTRIQCAWILIIAGCSWGDASMYYAAQRARKRP